MNKQELSNTVSATYVVNKLGNKYVVTGKLYHYTKSGDVCLTEYSTKVEVDDLNDVLLMGKALARGLLQKHHREREENNGKS